MLETVYRSVCGLDVHKKFVVACVRRIGEEDRIYKEVRRFETMTRNLKAMREWLLTMEVTHVAMESTGVFWKPILNILDGHFTQVMVVNARHVKNVPGRKTDVKDAEWIAQLLQCGLLKPSFVPDRETRERRDLTRHRIKLTEDRTAVANRIHKVLEDTNVKLGAVATDILGKSGRQMIESIIAGEQSPEVLAELARGRMRGKIPQLRVALEGVVTDHHRFQLKLLLEQYDLLSKQIEEISAKVDEQSTPLFDQAVELLCTAPGVSKRAAQSVLAEIGTDMKTFPTAENLASWAKVCPANNRSAGKDKASRKGKGNRWLATTMGHIAMAAANTKGTYVQSKYRRAARKRRAHALVVIQHDLLRSFYYMLKRSTPYVDLGPDYFDRRNREQLAKHLRTRLESLGFTVSLEAAA